MKLSDLKAAVDSATAAKLKTAVAVADATAALTAAQSSDARAGATAATAATAFAHGLLVNGGKAVDTSVTPPIEYSSIDGVTYAQAPVVTLDADVPDPAPASSTPPGAAA